MAHLSIIYWRDIPAQVIAEEGRGRNRKQVKVEMPRRFALAIDEAAMRDGLDSTDDYLAQWHKSDPEPCGDDLQGAVDVRLSELDAEYDQARLAGLVANGGLNEAPIKAIS